jgi:hypothetical protein
MDLNKMIPKAGSAIVTVTVFLFALFLINPFSSICFAVISFRIIPEYMNNGIGMSNYVNKILLIFAVMMIVISSIPLCHLSIFFWGG